MFESLISILPFSCHIVICACGGYLLWKCVSEIFENNDNNGNNYINKLIITLMTIMIIMIIKKLKKLKKLVEAFLLKM